MTSQNIHHLTKVLHILVLCCLQESSTTTDPISLTPTQKALAIVVYKIKTIANKSSSQSHPSLLKVESINKVVDHDLVQVRSYPSSTISNRTSYTNKLPNEILHLIFNHVEHQKDIATLGACSKRFDTLTQSALYHHPVFSSTEQFIKFVSSTKPTGGSSFSMVRNLTFLPCPTGTLSGKPFNESPSFNAYHSILFRLMTNHQTMISITGTKDKTSMETCPQKDFMPSKLVLHLIEQFPNLERLMESKVGVSFPSQGHSPTKRCFSPAENLEEGGFSNMLLDILLKRCKRLTQLSKDIGMSKFEYQTYLDFSLSFFELANQKFYPLRLDNSLMHCLRIQHQARSQLEKIGAHFVEILLASVHDHIKYLTFCSQKMLDCFSMIHYRSFSLARRVELNMFSEDCQILETQLTPRDKYEPIISSMKKAVKVLRTCFLRDNNADLEDLFYRLSATEISASSLDSESAEWIEFELNKHVIPFSSDEKENEHDLELLHALKSWLMELISWHKVSKELDSVRTALKSGLIQMEQFKEISTMYQVNLQI